jgi:hypothetical protein
LRPIGHVEARERVWAYDFQGGTWRLCMVDCRHDAEYDGPLVTLDIGVGEVTATAYHPIWVVEGQDLESRPALRRVDVNEDRGKSLPGRWVNSHDLREGDVLFLRGRGSVTVRRVMQRPERTPVCNLTVRELHTFAVGEAQVLVHNTSSSGPVFTKEMLSRSQVIARGKSIDKIDDLVAKFGGTRGGWVKKKGWDAAGREWHWYEHQGIGRIGVKAAGDPDPF